MNYSCLILRLMFEMHNFWPESWTFRYHDEIDFPEYHKVVEDPIAFDDIINRLDFKNPNQVRIVIYY